MLNNNFDIDIIKDDFVAKFKRINEPLVFGTILIWLTFFILYISNYDNYGFQSIDTVTSIILIALLLLFFTAIVNYFLVYEFQSDYKSDLLQYRIKIFGITIYQKSYISAISKKHFVINIIRKQRKPNDTLGQDTYHEYATYYWCYGDYDNYTQVYSFNDYSEMLDFINVINNSNLRIQIHMHL